MSAKTKHTAWCRALFDRLPDDGVWAIPRSGLVFRKNQKNKTLVLVGTFPHQDEKISHELAIAGDFFTTRKQFRRVGIAVEKAAGLREYASVDEAIADQKNRQMVRLS